MLTALCTAWYLHGVEDDSGRGIAQASWEGRPVWRTLEALKQHFLTRVSAEKGRGTLGRRSPRRALGFLQQLRGPSLRTSAEF